MTPEQITEMAKQAGCVPFYENSYSSIMFNKSKLQAFAQLVRNAALEDAAQLCEVNHHTIKRNPDSFECAAVIRGLKS